MGPYPIYANYRCLLCGWCALVGAQRHVPERKHPGLQRGWSKVRTPLIEPSLMRSGGSGKGKQGVRWQPPNVRGRWWGALLQVAGLIFFLFLCGRAPVCGSCPPGEN